MLNLLKIKAIILEGIYKNAEDLKNGMMNNENNIKLDYSIIHMYLKRMYRSIEFIYFSIHLF